MTSIRYSYHVDPLNAGRVITVAREIDSNGNIRFGYAVCKPTYWARPSPGKKEKILVLNKVVGDQFDKRKGRKIADGRLRKSPLIAVRSREDAEVHPMDIVRGHVQDMGVKGTLPAFVVRSIVVNLHSADGHNVNMKKLMELIRVGSGDISEASDNTHGLEVAG